MHDFLQNIDETQKVHFLVSISKIKGVSNNKKKFVESLIDLKPRFLGYLDVPLFYHIFQEGRLSGEAIKFVAHHYIYLNCNSKWDFGVYDEDKAASLFTFEIDRLFSDNEEDQDPANFSENSNKPSEE